MVADPPRDGYTIPGNPPRHASLLYTATRITAWFAAASGIRHQPRGTGEGSTESPYAGLESALEHWWIGEPAS
jgi:hypothetical protein